MNKKITIIVSGGCVQDAHNIPKGFEIEVRDYDVEGTDIDHDGIKEDEDGGIYQEILLTNDD